MFPVRQMKSNEHRMRLRFTRGQEDDLNHSILIFFFFSGSLLLRFGSATEACTVGFHWGRAGVWFWGNHLGNSREGEPAFLSFGF